MSGYVFPIYRGSSGYAFITHDIEGISLDPTGPYNVPSVERMIKGYTLIPDGSSDNISYLSGTAYTPFSTYGDA